MLYSIHEGEIEKQFSLIKKDEMSAEKIYAIGAKCVEEKTKRTLALYNELITHFYDYGNKCLYDTVVKGLPEFVTKVLARYDRDYKLMIDNISVRIKSAVDNEKIIKQWLDK